MGDFFSVLFSSVGDLVDTVPTGVEGVLEAGTSSISAGTQLVHEIHEVLAPS